MMDERQFNDWLSGRNNQGTGHLGGFPAPPEVEEKNHTFVITDNTVPILSISRHRIGVDGQGVNTLISFNGCKLNCKYCINQKCKESEEGVPRYSPKSLYEAVKIDDLYFQETGGGITFSGGEPLMYSSFIRKFSSHVRKKWKIRIETSLYWDADVFYKLYDIVDEWIIDIKSLDPKKYRAYTGGNFERMMKLLNLMSEFSFIRKRCIIRIPIIPGFTTEADAQETKQYLMDKDFFRFDIFTYILHKEEAAALTKEEGISGDNTKISDDSEQDKKLKDIQPTESKSKIGKLRCRFFRILRKRIASKLNLKLAKQDKCNFTGDCSGTCPACDSELKSLNEALKESK